MTSTENISQTINAGGCSLRLSRLCVYSKVGKIVYDQPFHSGLNVIRSSGNSRGKSTICDFIFYLLGGNVEKWSDASKRCELVIGEFFINSAIITLRRYLPTEDIAFPGLDICFSEMQKAIGNIAGWKRFPWKRSSQTESYSQFLFKTLGIPATKTDRESNITMHEALRLLYADQETAPDKIFRDQRFNSAETRQTIGELLLGYDDLKLHELRQDLRELDATKIKAEADLSAIRTIIDATYPDLRLADFTRLEAEKRLELEKLRTSVTTLTKPESLNKSQANTEKRSAQKELNAIGDKYASAMLRINNLKRSLSALKDDIQDSQRFITGLSRKNQALREAQASIALLGNLQFERCPSCLAPLDTHEVSSNQTTCCHLCRSPLIAGDLATRRLRLQHDLVNQIKESNVILTEKISAKDKLSDELAELTSLAAALQNRYNSLSATPDFTDQRIRSIFTKIGYTEKQIEDIREKRKLSERISVIEDVIAQTRLKIERVNAEISSVSSKRAERKQSVEDLISSIALNLLRKDLHSEENIDRATSFEFDFLRDRIVLDGRLTSRLSASTTAYMKSAFYCSLFLSSLDDPEIRIPRFIVIDSIEDKGIVPERVHNLHHILIEEIKSRKIEGQLIITTSLPSPEINEGNFGIGPVYNAKTMTLNFEDSRMEIESISNTSSNDQPTPNEHPKAPDA